MVTLKGPIHIGGKNDNLKEKLIEAGVKVKMPFEATGLKTSNPEVLKLIDTTKIQLKSDTKAIPDKPKEKPVPEPKPKGRPKGKKR